jgi:peroxiredoxin
VSAYPIDTLNKFSVSECRNKFAVASDADHSITKSYDAVLKVKPEYADRTSYVITPDHKIIYEYTAMNPDKHVENTMAAVQKWKSEHKS